MSSVRFICVLVVLVITELVLLKSAVAIALPLTSSHALAEQKLHEKIFIYETFILARINLQYNYLYIKSYLESLIL